MISVHEGRKTIIADMFLTAVIKCTFFVDAKELEEIAEFFDMQAKYQVIGESGDNIDIEDKAMAKVYTAIAEYARSLRKEEKVNA